MAPIVETIEINRSPDDVFAYVDQLERHGEWQQSIVSTSGVTSGPVKVGTRATDVRRGPAGMKISVTYEIVEHNPPLRTRFKGVNGPVRVVGAITIESVENGAKSKVTLELDFAGRGIGKLFAPMARRQAAKLVPGDQQRLKERLEAGA
jgi:uncharacterized membrane protein